MPKYWIGTVDGKNWIISHDKMDLPAGARPAPINSELTDARLERLIPQGGTVVVIKGDKNNEVGSKRGR